MRHIAILLALIFGLSGQAYAMMGVTQNAGAPLELIVQYQSPSVAPPSFAAGAGFAGSDSTRQARNEI
jgi:hypothetical protein